jgi:ribosome biogenesis protein Tsr3
MLRLLLVASLVAGCGKRSYVPPADSGPIRDAPPADWTPPDLSPPPDRGPDMPPVTPGCAALAPYATPQKITPLRARQALHRAALDRVLLVTWAQGSDVGDIVAIALPKPAPSPAVLAKGVSQIEWLDVGQSTVLFRKPKSSQSYDLIAVSVDGTGGQETLATSVCGHRVASGGSHVYAVRNCTEGKGTLERIEKTGVTEWIADGVASNGVVLSPDGQWAAFVADVAATRGCSYPRGVLHTVDSAGKVEKGVSEVLDRSLQVLPGSKHVVFKRRSGPGCQEADIALERAAVDAPSTAEKLESGLAFGYFWDTDPDRLYQVSPDGKTLLAAKLDMASAKAQLVAVDTTGGSPPVLLAADLFPFQMVSMAFQPFALSASGQHAVYASTPSTGYPEMGLSVVPAAGGKPVPLTSKLIAGAYTVSRTTDAVAYLEQQAPSGTRLWLATPKTGAAQMRHATAGGIYSTRFLPDGRGLLVVETTSGSSTLRYVSATGPATNAGLGGWSQSHLSLHYHVDPGSCAVVYDSDQGGGGTYLALIPR